MLRAARSVRHIPRSSSRDETSTEDDDTTSLSDLVEVEVGGVTVSPQGFIAMLVRKGMKDSMPKAANTVEAMRGADPSTLMSPESKNEFLLPILLTAYDEDQDAANSAKAQTMLQLLQEPPCDMGIQLPYGALEALTESADAVLGAVLIGKAQFEDEQFIWESTILAGQGMDQSAVDVIGNADEAWQCLALARRYETYGCRVFVTKEAIEEAAKNNELFGDESSERKPLTLSTVRDAFPKMQTVNESRQIATDASEKFLWQPFAAATSEDVPVVEEDEVEEEK